MSQIAYFNLPDVGEGLTEAEIVSWKIAVGDNVTVNQIIVEIETAKSLVELPVPFAGVVSELLAKEGDTVEVGKPIIAVRVAAAVGNLSTATSAITIITEPDAPAATAEAAATPGKTPNLVGYGVMEGSHSGSRRRRGPIAATGSAVAAAAASLPAANPATELHNTVAAAAAEKVLAKPPIRKLARDLGVDLSRITGSGAAGEILREDVVSGATQASVFRNLSTPDAPKNLEERIPVKGVRKAIAAAMVQSAFTAPHVSIFVDVDATRTMEYVKRLKTAPEFAGVKVTPLLIMAKAMIWAVRRNPMVNSTWTDTEIIVHNFVNFGIAAATPRGLIVPNIKNADKMSMLELAEAIQVLAATAREGKTTPADMKDGTITITNIGVFGVDTGTPILNPGEVGIVALGSIRPKPWVVNNEILIRQVTTIGATFDHRVVDGDVASRFVQDVASVMEEPALLLD